MTRKEFIERYKDQITETWAVSHREAQGEAFVVDLDALLDSTFNAGYDDGREAGYAEGVGSQR